MRARQLDKKVIKLDLGVETPEAGFIACPVKKRLPYPDHSVTLISAAHVIEKIPKEKFIAFMDECWRVLKEDGQFRIAVYYAGSTPFWADPKNVNGVTIQTFNFFDPETMGGNLYKKYKPKPWKILNCFVQVECTIEILLAKRREGFSKKQLKRLEKFQDPSL